jgi:hypothetical protein
MNWIYAVDLPAGPHTVKVRNAGTDWLYLSFIQFTGFGTFVGEPFGIAGDGQAFLWIRDSRMEFGQPTPGVMSGVKVRIPDLEPGTYDVEFWDPETGQVACGSNALTTGDGLEVALPDFERAIAVKARYTGPPVLVLEELDSAPDRFALFGNYPNPFYLSTFGQERGSTTISYELERTGRGDQYVTLKIFDLLGRQVRTLVDGLQNSGRHVVPWDGRDDGGRPVAPGVYAYILSANGRVRSGTMTLLR